MAFRRRLRDVVPPRRRMLVVDASPTQNEHRHRGIGYYVSGLVRGLILAQPEQPWAPLRLRDHPVTGVPATLGGPVVWRPRALEYHYGWLLDEVMLPLLAARGKWRLFHATDPRYVPDPRLVPTVSTIYDLTPLRDPATWAGLSWDQRLAYRRALGNARRARAIVTISESVKMEIAEALDVPPGKVHVVYPGIDPLPPGPPPDRLPRSLLFVGAPAPHKGLDVLLDALSLLPRKVDLTIVGPWTDSASEDFLGRARKRRLGNVRIEPFASTERLSELYRSVGALVLPSRSEGFGIPVLEAMNAGCPTIVTDLPVLREIAGIAATFVPVGDAPALAAAIDAVVNDPAEQVRRMRLGHKQATRFSWESSIHNLLEVYRLAVELH